MALTPTQVDERLKKGIELFNQRKFFESSDTIEDLWRQTPGEYKKFYQGLIQVAAAFHQLRKGKLRPAIAICDSAIQLLKSYPPIAMGFQVQKLIVDMERFFEPFRNLESVQDFDFQKAKFPAIAFAS